MRYLIVPVFLLFLSLQVTAQETAPIKIGGIFILSGQGVQYGTHARQGAMLALEKINGRGGIKGRPLEVIWEDERSGKAERAVASYRKLVHIDGVRIIFGPTFQDGLMAIAPLLRKDKVFLITPAAPRLGLDAVFSTWPDPEGECAEIAALVRPQYERVAVLSGQQSWEQLAARGFVESFEKIGGKITTYQEPLVDTASVKAEVLKVKASKPQAVFISSFTLFSLYAKELKRQGLVLPIFTIEADNSVIRNAEGTAEGTISIGPFASDSNFVKAYRERYNSEPDIPSLQSYDAMMLLAEALSAGDGTAHSVEEYFTSLREYQGVSGVIRNNKGKIVVRTGFSIAKGDNLIPWAP